MKRRQNYKTFAYLWGIFLLLPLFLIACTPKNKTEEPNLPPKDIETKVPEEAEKGVTDMEKIVSNPLKPFPQHTNYGEGIIKPNHITQKDMDESTGKLYDEWKKKYIKERPDKKGQYYVWYSDGEWFKNGTGEERIASTVSEAHGYGMLITVIMAGYDDFAKQLFDGMFYYFKDHPSSINPNLMAWQQGIKDGKVIKIGGDDCATDGDMDIAYSLLMADKQWGSDGQINYLEEGKLVINALMDNCVDQNEWFLRIGDWASSGSYSKLTRTSDFMLQHMRAFRDATQDERWDQVIDKTYDIIKEVYHNNSESTGLMPDFLRINNGAAEVPEKSVLESEYDGSYNYNACRTYWRIGTDYIMNKEARAEEPIRTLNQWIISDTEGNPANIKSGYFLDGMPLPNRNYTDITFSSPFLISAMADEEYQDWLNHLWDYNLRPQTQSNYYFGNTIRLLNYITVSGNWWTP